MNLRLEVEKPLRSEQDEQKWDAAITQLEKLRELEDDWDGNGAPAPTAELIEAAIRMIVKLRFDDYPAPRSAVPTFDGTVSVQWAIPDGFWELEFLTPSEMEEATWVSGKELATLTRHAI